MNVLVTGGAGFLGRHLVRKLVDEGHQVKIVDLEPLEDDRFQDDPVQFIQGDVTDPKAMEEACDSVDAVVHAAAALPLESEQSIRETDYRGTEVTLEAAKESEVQRFVYISTTAVYGIHDSTEPVSEDAPKNPVGPYGQSKYDAEKLCREYENDFFVSIIRPKTFVGPERLGIMEVLFDWIRRGKTFIYWVMEPTAINC